MQGEDKGETVESLKDILQIKKEGLKKERSFRESLINEFIERINKERIGTKYKPVTAKGIALKINMNPFLKQSWQLESFLKQCKRAKSFGSCFYGSLKIK